MIQMSKTTSSTRSIVDYVQPRKPAAPSEVTVQGKRLQNAQEAEAVLNFKG